VIFIFGIIENIKNFSVDQNYIQRFLSASSEREAVKSLWLGWASIYSCISPVLSDWYRPVCFLFAST
jgi:SSS family solute:Na+ symporter